MCLKAKEEQESGQILVVIMDLLACEDDVDFGKLTLQKRWVRGWESISTHPQIPNACLAEGIKGNPISESVRANLAQDRGCERLYLLWHFAAFATTL